MFRIISRKGCFMKLTIRFLAFVLLISSLMAVDTLNCIANYNLSPPLNEASLMDPAALGDINADGYEDWAFTFHDANEFYPRDSIQIYFGSDSIDFTCDHTLQAHRINCVGDINGDGYDDVSYLRTYVNNMHHSQEPRIFLLHGGPSFDFTPDDSCTFVNGTAYKVNFSSLKELGDINGDGYDDICCGPTWDLGSYITKPSMLPAGSIVGKMFLYLGGDTLSWLPDAIVTPPITYTDTSWDIGFYWGNYNGLGDINSDGYDDFSMTFIENLDMWTPPEESKYLTLIYYGHSNLDTIINSVDTLFWGRIMQDLGDVSHNDKKAFICDYKDSTGLTQHYGISYADNILNAKITYSAYQQSNVVSGDLNGDGYNDWCVYDDDLNICYGSADLNDINDVVLPLGNIPDSFCDSRITFLGDICGDGKDKLMILKRDNSGVYKTYCYSYNIIETEIASIVPFDFKLINCYPNPFNPSLTINYQLPVQSDLELSVYDLNGRHVSTLYNGQHESGIHSLQWNASDMPSGVYVVRMLAGQRIDTGKIVLLK